MSPSGDTSPMNGPVQFTTTLWNVILEAGQSGSPHSLQALEKLCRTYWRPLYAFVRRQGYSPEESQDLTQGFFARLLQRRDFENVRREKGRFRSYLLVSLRHFIVNEWHQAKAAKRGGGHTTIPLEELVAEEPSYLEPSNALTAEHIFERRWALTVLAQVLNRLAHEFGGNPELFEAWRHTLEEETTFTQADLAGRLEMTENALKQAFHRLRQRYRDLLREEIASTVATPMEIEDELRHLVTVLRR